MEDKIIYVICINGAPNSAYTDKELAKKILERATQGMDDHVFQIKEIPLTEVINNA